MLLQYLQQTKYLRQAFLFLYLIFKGTIKYLHFLPFLDIEMAQAFKSPSPCKAKDPFYTIHTMAAHALEKQQAMGSVAMVFLPEFSFSDTDFISYD